MNSTDNTQSSNRRLSSIAKSVMDAVLYHPEPALPSIYEDKHLLMVLTFSEVFEQLQVGNKSKSNELGDEIYT